MKISQELLSEITQPEGAENQNTWRDRVFSFGSSLGFSHAALALFPGHDVPIVTGNAFLLTNLPQALLARYDQEKMGEIDPVIHYCASHSTPLIWSAQDFSTTAQKGLYEEAGMHGIRSGVSLPYHGPNGEFGVLSYTMPEAVDTSRKQALAQVIPELSWFRDAVMERFAGMAHKNASMTRNGIEVTAREMECLKWCAAGKSSWDIANLMNCSEATVNFHFGNIRRKFGASSRQAAVIKAIRLGFLSL